VAKLGLNYPDKIWDLGKIWGPPGPNVEPPLVGYNSVADISGLSLFIYPFQNREITRNSDKIRPYNSSRSSKVVDLGVKRKLIM